MWGEQGLPCAALPPKNSARLTVRVGRLQVLPPCCRETPVPQIFDNIDQDLLPALRKTIEVAYRADFCVGYFNLRGWRLLAPLVEHWDGGEGKCCRVLVGMHRLPEEELRAAFGTGAADGEIDNQTAVRIKRRLAESFRTQLTLGAPTNDDEAGLRQLAAQLRAKKVVVKLFLQHTLHAKLYLLFRNDHNIPVVGYLGSSNLTMAGLKRQGELNVDVLEQDACKKLTKWFEERWAAKWCIDISADLAQLIEESWAREVPIPPHHIYVKMAYHLSHEARTGLAEYKIPAVFGNRLFEFQKAAVKIAAHHLNKRGGVILGDVVGLGKTLMATAVARIFEDDHQTDVLILCPKNLVTMWQGYCHDYGLRGRVMSLSVATRDLPTLRRYRLVLIDESHNLRNREGKRYSVIREYVRANDSRCILLSATPYNKSYLDLANQLRLFMPEDRDLGVRPERYLSTMTEAQFLQKHQCGPRTLAAFEKSEYADDWRELMRLFLVRRTRSFIQDNYAETDPNNGRKFLTFEDGKRSYFPTRVPRTAKFTINDADPGDQYARLYSDDVVEAINKLTLPRYGLGNYAETSPAEAPTQAEARSFQDLSRAGKRLMGFCRTNLFKRLESSGHAFVQSVERHLLRNYVYLHALANKVPVPIGTQGAELLDTRQDDEEPFLGGDEEDDEDAGATPVVPAALTEADFRARAEEVYALYAGRYRNRFRWVRSGLFRSHLARDLKKDNKLLLGVLAACGPWDAARDRKLDALADLLTKTHAQKKVLVFSQFADTVEYLEEQLRARGVARVAGATGGTADPTTLAYRFSPVSNGRRAQASHDQELNVLLATDVLSEGQNLQDCSIVVNYDLPWAIIRLVQRAGRVDRIGQTADRIDCYSFLPADGVERIIRLRSRVVQRLQENAEVVGTDEAFFEGDAKNTTVVDLYHEKSGVLDADADGEVDLASYAYQIWKNAITAEPALQKTIPDLAPVVYSAKAHAVLPDAPPGVLVYTRTSEGSDALVWFDKDGKSVTESQFTILKAAACLPETPVVPRSENHHALVQKALAFVVNEEKVVGGQLGSRSGARYKTYMRLTDYIQRSKGTVMQSVVAESDALNRAVGDLLRYPLKETASDALNRQLRTGIEDDALADLVVALREQDKLCVVAEEAQQQEAQIICSLGLVAPAPGA